MNDASPSPLGSTFGERSSISARDSNVATRSGRVSSLAREAKSDPPQLHTPDLGRSPELIAWVEAQSQVKLLFGFAGGTEVWLEEGESYRGFSVVHADAGWVVTLDRATRRSQRWCLVRNLDRSPASSLGARPKVGRG
ncbi:MAG: hypothetical protein AAF488_08510 [Planctomycetota bacterium]